MERRISHPERAFRDEWCTLLNEVQSEICASLEAFDLSTSFTKQPWFRGEDGGGGVSCVLQDGVVFEKAGVNVSSVEGKLHPAAAIEMCARNHLKPSTPCPQNQPLDGQSSANTALDYHFFAAGLSLVIHPHNPFVPTIHANFRFMQVFADKEMVKPICWWFGGGVDLSPSYVIDEDCVFFHQTLKDVCDMHDPKYYPRFNKWCDSYFRNHHRDEARGIGGIFFDDLNEDMIDPMKIRNFCADCLRSFSSMYTPIVAKRVSTPYTEEHKRWQQLRRGRYVEFNLVHDRGTKFGLMLPNSRVESILMSLPLTARWEYDVQVQEGTQEHESLKIFKRNKKWVAYEEALADGFVIPQERTAIMKRD